MGIQPRRRVLVVNRLEDRIPGRLAFIVHRGRSSTRARSLTAYRHLQRWADERHRRILAEQRDASAENDNGSAEPRADVDLTASDDRAEERPASSAAPRPDDTWTKGEIYELARQLEIDGRSKLNKADLLDAVLETLDRREHDRPDSDDDHATSQPDELARSAG